ncbi:MAG: SDR family oxidoreductase [bacterium]|nr:SDR family oxidoreductase [bacterium]
MNQLDLTGKTALVTGGNRGIGQEIALRLASLGAKVAICGRNEALLKETINEIKKTSPESFYQVVNIRSEQEQLNFFSNMKKHFKHLDICIPNAGEATLATASNTTLEDWNRDIETNLTGLFITSREALKIMMEQKSGNIIPIISKAGKVVFETRAAYCASKWGALGFTKAMALEAQKYNISVTAICPASVATDFQKGNPYGTDWMLNPSDVTDTVEYILSCSDQVKIEEILLETKYISKK